MDILHAIILSVVEGLTEFLPISSTGHLILASDLLKISQTEFVKSFEIFIQLGAICAVIFLYFKDFLSIKKWPPVIIAFIPTGIIGFILYKFVKTYLLGNSTVVLAALLIGGVSLILIEYFHKEKEGSVGTIEEISYRNAILIGIAQSLAVIPGVSRSAATIVGSMLLGLKRKTAVEFSFVLAVPTMIAASGLDLIKSHEHFSLNQYEVLGIGFIGSFIVALIAIKFLLKYVQNHTFIPFGIYRIIVSILFWLLIIK